MLTNAMMVLMLVGIVIILIAMWTLFPTMLIGNIIVTAGALAWAMLVFREG